MSLLCEAPVLPRDLLDRSNITLGLVMDGVTELLSLNQTITVYRDPVFFPLTIDNSSLVFEEGVYDVINITVSSKVIHILSCVSLDCYLVGYIVSVYFRPVDSAHW